MIKIILIPLVVFVLVYNFDDIYSKIKNTVTQTKNMTVTVVDNKLDSEIIQSKNITTNVVSYNDAENNDFTCDGRTYCSQMTSREEADFFIRNCPNTKMDGNHNGIPCEADSRW